MTWISPSPCTLNLDFRNLNIITTNKKITQTQNTTMEAKKCIIESVKTIAVVLGVFMIQTVEAQTVRINIADARFTQPLMETLINEYRKVNPQFAAEIVSTAGDGDATVNITNDGGNVSGTLAHYVLLPIANAQGSLSQDKRLRKGLNAKLTRELFVGKSTSDYFESQESKQIQGTAYVLGGKHAITTELLAHTLNVDISAIKGKKVIGREENVITAVLQHTDAIAVDVASLVYDSDTRKPAKGLVILPVDLDGDGHVSNEERAAIQNIDALTDYLSTHGKNGLPTGSIRINSNDSRAESFIVWATTVGQDYVKQLGYLRSYSNVAQK